METDLVFTPVDGTKYSFDYQRITSEINRLVDSEPKKFLQFMRFWCREDLFFLLYFILKVPVNHPWLVERIKEVQGCNDRTLDLWSREHYKSTIITYGLNIQEILRNPDTSIGIFSHTRTIARSFLRRIKLTFETNDLLKALFPDILYEKPETQSPKWSEDEGILVKRSTVLQEMTVESWGLVDGMPTSKHFQILNYDDVVTRESVNTPDQLRKIDDCFKLSLNLGTQDGKKRVIGTIYHFNDQYIKMQQQVDIDGKQMWKVRKHPCYDETGKPVLLTEAQLEEKKIDQGPYVFATQMLLNPVADTLQEFKPEWLQYWQTLPEPIHLYGLCDPANSKKKGSDYTVIAVVGLDALGGYYLVDAVRGRMNLRERWMALKETIMMYPKIKKVGYEKYAMQADREYFHQMMRAEGFNFIIEDLGGQLAKKERIRRLVPIFASDRFYLPYSLHSDGVDLTKVFVEEEYNLFPYCPHDDFLDAVSRICDESFAATRPVSFPDMEEKRERYSKKSGQRRGTWMSM